MASATGTKRWMGKWLTACAMMAVCGGCRSCAEDRETAPDARALQPVGPTMPTGMLMPVDATSAREDAGAMRVARGIKSGAWVELQVAAPGDSADRRDFKHWNDDSWFLPLETMTLLHEPFARALPGFDLFLPRLFPPDALVKLGDELAAFGRSANADTAKTANDLAQLVRSTAAKKQSLWVLGPP